MTPGLRSFGARWRGLAVLMCAAVLALRVLVPAGFMPMRTAHGVLIQPCDGIMPARMAAMMAPHGHGGTDKRHDGVKDDPCPYSAMAHSPLGGADPVLLVAALAFAMLLRLLVPQRQTQQRAPRLWPRPRDPPIFG